MIFLDMTEQFGQLAPSKSFAYFACIDKISVVIRKIGEATLWAETRRPPAVHIENLQCTHTCMFRELAEV